MHGAMISVQTCFFVHSLLELLNEVCFNSRVHYGNKVILVKSRFSAVLVMGIIKLELLWK